MAQAWDDGEAIAAAAAAAPEDRPARGLDHGPDQGPDHGLDGGPGGGAVAETVAGAGAASAIGRTMTGTRGPRASRVAQGEAVAAGVGAAAVVARMARRHGITPGHPTPPSGTVTGASASAADRAPGMGTGTGTGTGRQTPARQTPARQTPASPSPASRPRASQAAATPATPATVSPATSRSAASRAAAEAADVAEAASAARAATDAARAAWTALAGSLRQDLGARTYDHWLRTLSVDALCPDTGTLRLAAPSSFAASWVADRFGDRLTLAFRQHLPIVRALIVRAAAPAPAQAPTPSPLTPSPVMLAVRDGAAVDPPGRVALVGAVASGPAPRDRAAEAEAAVLAGFDPRLSFDRFIIARANILAANAAKRMALPDRPLFSPLYLHSGTGQGKTHLLQATGQAFAAAHPGASVILVSAERFMREFVAAMREHQMVQFKDRLRRADCLLLDDLQFVIGKGSTQEELLHTIDDLMTGGRRLVIAADRPPHALDGIEARLQSRLEGGLVADILPPDEGLREAIVLARVAELGSVTVPRDVVDWLVGQFTRNIRELEGALNKLHAYATLTGAAIDLSLAQDRLADALRPSTPRITIDQIQRAVCQHYKLERADMSSKRRLRCVARPRQVAMYLAKELTQRSYPEIGRKFGGRDHSTVIHAVKAIEALRASDPDLDTDVQRIRRTLVG